MCGSVVLKQEPPGSFLFVLALCMSCPVFMDVCFEMPMLFPSSAAHSRRLDYCLLRGLDRCGTHMGMGTCLVWTRELKMTAFIGGYR